MSLHELHIRFPHVLYYTTHLPDCPHSKLKSLHEFLPLFCSMTFVHLVLQKFYMVQPRKQNTFKA